jgi:hypothetical protein
MGIRVRDRRLLRVWIQRSTGFRDFSLNSDRSPRVSFDGWSRFLRDFSFLLPSTSGVRVSGFHDLRRQGFLPFGFPDAETPKRRPAATCPSDGRRRPSAKINGRDLFGMINGHDQIPAFLNLIHTSRHFGVSVIGISRLAKTRVLALWFPGCRNAEALTSSHVYSIDGRSRYFHGPWGSTVPIPSSLARVKRVVALRSASLPQI